MKAINNFITIKKIILEQIELTQSQTLKFSPECNNTYEEEKEPQNEFREQLVQREILPRSQKEKMKEAAVRFKEIDYELEQKRSENNILEKSLKIANDIDEMNMQMNEQLVIQNEKLKDTNQEATKAAQNSGAALKEVKKKARNKWTWLGLKMGLWGTAGGAVVGGVVGTVPGAVIGGAAGALGGGYAGTKITKEAKKKIDKVQPQKPEYL